MKTKEELNAYQREYRKRKRRERGLQKSGRQPTLITPELIQESKEKRKQWEKQWTREYFRNNPIKRLLWTARSRAKRKGLECTIEECDIILPTHCPYLGIKLVLTAGRGTPRTFIASLDRIDSSKGYIKGNVEVISWLANTMKNNATPEQLVQFSRTVLDRYEHLGV